MGLMNGLDLFSGIGGLSLALKPWVRSVAYCERDTYAQSVLLSRIVTGELDRAPIWDDITSLDGSMLPKLDIIFGGFPCQDISVAGRGEGLGGERSGLYFEVERLIKETRPTFVFLENVPAIRTRGLGRVVSGLAALGYDCRWTVVSAASVGAPHKRDRWFLLAYADRNNIREQQGWGSGSDWERETQSGLNGSQESLADSDSVWKQPEQDPRKQSSDWIGDSSQTLADTKRTRLEGHIGETREPKKSELGRSSWWSVEPNVGRLAHGVPFRVDRLRCSGNAVVSLQAQTAFKILAGLKC